MEKGVVLNKYRNELGKLYRKVYDNGMRNEGVIVHLCVHILADLIGNAVLSTLLHRII